jgi:hypothetical protein
LDWFAPTVADQPRTLSTLGGGDGSMPSTVPTTDRFAGRTRRV